MYLLGSSSVVKNHVLSDYLDIGELIINIHLTVTWLQELSIFYKSAFGILSQLKNCYFCYTLKISIKSFFIIVTYNPPTPPKIYIYIYNPSHTSSTSKNIAWSNQNGNEATENEISHLDLTKVSNQNWKPNLLSQSTSSTVSSS